MFKKWRAIISGLLLLGCILIFINLQYTTYDKLYVSKPTRENESDFYSGFELQDILKETSVHPENSLSGTVDKAISEFLGSHEKTNTSQSFKTILLLSSVGRSGSSFLGELLASQENNIYMYEPIRALPRDEQFIESNVQEELIKNFKCQIRPSFLEIGQKPYVSVKHPYTYGKKLKQVKIENLEEVCEQESLRIIKTIRTRLTWTRKLLENKTLNLKVIHLVRDPRGSFDSISGLDWKMTPEQMCQKIEEDLKERQEISKLYPGRYMFIKYEDFCLDPYSKTAEIFRFLSGKNTTSSEDVKMGSSPKDSTARISHESFPDIPERVFTYLDTHIHVNMFSEKSPWTTVRESSTVYQKWRKKITQKELSDVEENCQDTLRVLGHRTFGSLENAKNFSISLFL